MVAVWLGIALDYGALHGLGRRLPAGDLRGTAGYRRGAALGVSLRQDGAAGFHCAAAHSHH